MMAGHFVAHDLFIILHVTLKFCGQLGGCVEHNENIVAFGLVVDGVCKTTLAPFINIFDHAAVCGDNTVELLDYGLGFLLIKLRHDNIQTFVLIHLIHLLMVIWHRTCCGARCWHNIITFSLQACKEFFHVFLQYPIYLSYHKEKDAPHVGYGSSRSFVPFLFGNHA